MIASPLRYPGGKASLTSLLTGIRRLNALGDRSLAEPYAGGAGASLSLLYLEETSTVRINDADRRIYAFWWALLARTRTFLERVQSAKLNLREWKRQRTVYRSRIESTSQIDLAFATFYLNRCNRSGIIIDGGPIGGFDQQSEWGIDARFNRDELVRRCRRVAEYRDRIKVSCLDGIEFISTLDLAKTMLFIDPPYFEKGELLYMNRLDTEYHKRLAATLKSIPHAAWVLTYDDCCEVRAMYADWANVRPFRLRYAASKRRSGNELLITPPWMRLPETQRSSAVYWN